MTRIRKDVWKLGAGWSDTLEWYARGVAELQSRPVDDPTSWRFMAAMHGMHPTVWETFGYLDLAESMPSNSVIDRFWHQCQHQSWYFLPWHRGYLAAFEWLVLDAIVSLGGPDDWALPYWNYSDASEPNARQLPDAFSEDTLPDGSPNPLSVEHRFGSGFVPITLDSADVALTALGDTEFEGSRSDIPPGFGGPETPFNHSQGANGDLESLPHNVIHGGIGGSDPNGDPNDWQSAGLMSMPDTAALDPIFWLHHANIDRLWTVWLAMPGHENTDNQDWLDGPTDREFVMPLADGSEWVFKPSEVLDTTADPLDYSYEDETPPVIQPRIQRRLSRLGAPAAAIAAASAEEEPAMAERKKAELIGSSEAPVRVTGATRAAVKVDEQASKDLKRRLASAAAGQEGAEPDRVYLKLEGIRGTSDAANYRVYIDLPAGADPKDYPDLYAGTISLFGVSAATNPGGAHAGSGISQVLEITEIVDALHLSGDDLSQLKVQFLPAHENVAAADFTVGQLSVFRLGR